MRLRLVKLNLNRVAAEVRCSLTVKYKISYEIETPSQQSGANSGLATNGSIIIGWKIPPFQLLVGLLFELPSCLKSRSDHRELIYLRPSAGGAYQMGVVNLPNVGKVPTSHKKKYIPNSAKTP